MAATSASPSSSTSERGRLSHDLNRVTWTFDPLVRRNAYFNLVKLGATAVAFHRDFYGSMHDTVNAGDLSDRILIEWNLDAPRAVQASVLRPEPVDLRSLDRVGAVVRLTDRCRWAHR